MKKLLLALTITIAAGIAASNAQTSPKREFRGVWMPTVTGEYTGLSEKAMKAKLSKELDKLQSIGINAVFFQVRPEADAWYKSQLEPWSRFITGKQGNDPGWDPVAFMAEECRKRCIEFHAWINPYRVKTSPSTELSAGHIYYRHPELFFEYGGQTFFKPSRQESREFICNIIKDLAMNYDIDGIHMDDYFYPYPKDGEELPDFHDFKSQPRGFDNIGDWRRDNINKLVKQIRDTIDSAAPWVQFGISPFGIYRNKSSHPSGSLTKGLQNYDDLYADIMLWINKGWIDYVAPQIYWEAGHPAADYDELVGWWSKNVNGKCLLYIGQDVARSVKEQNQQRAKLDTMRKNSNIDGYSLYCAKELVNNTGDYAEVLRAEYNPCPALPHVAKRFARLRPPKPKKAKVVDTAYGKVLFWEDSNVKDCFSQPTKYCVYLFDRKKDINLGQSSGLLKITNNPFIAIDAGKGRKKRFYVITAVDRFNNESSKLVKKVKL